LTTRPLLLVGGNNDEAPPSLPASIQSSAQLSQFPVLHDDLLHDETHFPAQLFDVNAQQVDMRDHTTWTTKLADVSTPEAVEVMAVNTLAPLVFNARLKPLLLRTRDADLQAGGGLDLGRYIVNVSSMEGKFFRVKDVVHPHNNMAKAALNMMTKTSGPDYAQDGIFMTSVDTGWLSNEAPVPTAVKIAATNFQTPIDEIDGAARVLDPVFSGMRGGEKVYGVFLKDDHVSEW
jgi:NAD(P)-dependent dehydrogenase (short-subunit alcohol dehydrogenase family)